MGAQRFFLHKKVIVDGEVVRGDKVSDKHFYSIRNAARVLPDLARALGFSQDEVDVFPEGEQATPE